MFYCYVDYIRQTRDIFYFSSRAEAEDLADARELDLIGETDLEFFANMFFSADSLMGIDIYDIPYKGSRCVHEF